MLLQKDDILHNIPSNTWRFIVKLKNTNKITKETILQEVEREIQIKLQDVMLLSEKLHEGTKEYIFHAKLTDKNVNSIKRNEGSIHQFFTLKELQKLPLETSTQLTISRYEEIIAGASQN